MAAETRWNRSSATMRQPKVASAPRGCRCFHGDGRARVGEASAAAVLYRNLLRRGVRRAGSAQQHAQNARSTAAGIRYLQRSQCVLAALLPARGQYCGRAPPGRRPEQLSHAHLGALCARWLLSLNPHLLRIAPASCRRHAARALTQTQTSLLLGRCGLGARPQYPRARLALVHRVCLIRRTPTSTSARPLLPPSRLRR